ncbi:MAG: hypothetical protein AAGA58_14295 [Verrucomicrobiota bacterium]
MKRFLHTFIHCLMGVVFLTAGGLHLALLQFAAWGTMIATDLQERGVESAIERTFSGDHPCEMCKRIAVASSSENSQEQDTPHVQVKIQDFKFVASKLVQLCVPNFERTSWHDFAASGDQRHDACPHAPPQVTV